MDNLCIRIKADSVLDRKVMVYLPAAHYLALQVAVLIIQSSTVSSLSILLREETA